MMSDDAPLSVSIAEHHGIASGSRYCLTVADIGEHVVPRADSDFPVASIVLLAEGDSRIRALRRILEIFGDGCRGCGYGLRRRAPKDGVCVVHSRYPPRITTIVCGAPSRRRGCHLILPRGSTTCRAG